MTADEIVVQKRIADALERIAKVEEGRQQAADGTAELVLKLAERFLDGRESPVAEALPVLANGDAVPGRAYGGIIFHTHSQLRAYISAVEILLSAYGSTHKPEANTCMVVAQELLSRFRASENGGITVKLGPGGAGYFDPRCKCGHHRGRHASSNGDGSCSLVDPDSGEPCGCREFVQEAPAGLVES